MIASKYNPIEWPASTTEYLLLVSYVVYLLINPASWIYLRPIRVTSLLWLRPPCRLSSFPLIHLQPPPSLSLPSPSLSPLHPSPPFHPPSHSALGNPDSRAIVVVSTVLTWHRKRWSACANFPASADRLTPAQLLVSLSLRLSLSPREPLIRNPFSCLGLDTLPPGCE